jgi:hypothetical protein
MTGNSFVNCTAGFRRTDVERYRYTTPKLDRRGTIEREELFVISAV